MGLHTETYFFTFCWAPVVHGPSVNVPAARMNHPPLGMLLVSDLDCSDDFVFVFVLNVVFVDQKQNQNRAYSYLLVAYLMMLLFFSLLVFLRSLRISMIINQTKAEYLLPEGKLFSVLEPFKIRSMGI